MLLYGRSQIHACEKRPRKVPERIISSSSSRCDEEAQATRHTLPWDVAS